MFWWDILASILGWKMKIVCTSETWYPPTRKHSVILQKATIFTTMKTSNFIHKDFTENTED